MPASSIQRSSGPVGRFECTERHWLERLILQRYPDLHEEVDVIVDEAGHYRAPGCVDYFSVPRWIDV
jgi:hypothetical protein